MSDPTDKLETRIYRDFDRRFDEMNKKLEDLKKQIEEVDEKTTGRLGALAERKRENYVWFIRTAVAAAVSAVVGAGAVGFIELLGRLR